MESEKHFAWSFGQLLLVPVPIIGILTKLLPSNVGVVLLMLAVVLTGLAIYFSGRDLGKAQNTAATNSKYLTGIYAAVRVTDTAPVGLREETAALVGAIWRAVIDLYKADNVPAPAWSSAIMGDFTQLSDGYREAFNRTSAFMQGSDFTALQQKYIVVRSRLFELRRADGSYLLTKDEMQLLQNMSVQKDLLEQQAQALQNIIPRIGSLSKPSGSRRRWWHFGNGSQE
jgi:hypothetical protein